MARAVADVREFAGQSPGTRPMKFLVETMPGGYDPVQVV
jgi:hypothetical protein